MLDLLKSGEVFGLALRMIQMWIPLWTERYWKQMRRMLGTSLCLSGIKYPTVPASVRLPL